MRNVTFFVLLGILSVVGTGLGLSWELIFAIVGTLMAIHALIKAEGSERLLKSIAGDVRALCDLREELRQRLAPRGRLVNLLRWIFRRPKRPPPGAPS